MHPFSRLGVRAFALGAILAGVVPASHAVRAGSQEQKVMPQTYKGLAIAVSGVGRATRVSLRDCPPGTNTVRGVIRPGEENEFVTVTIDIEVLPSFQPVELPKPVLHDTTGATYKTAQSFTELSSSPKYSCEFAFRVPTGTKAVRLAIEEAAFDLAQHVK